MPPRRRPPRPAEPPPPPSRGAVLVRVAAVVLALAALVGAAVFEGIRGQRWGVPEDLKAAAAKLDAVPAAFGDWDSAVVEIDRKILERAEAVGSVSRVYRNSRTGAVVSVLLLCGPAGPIASHTPDVCYAGIGYTMEGGQVRKTIDPPAGPAAYWSARFVKDPAEPALEVCWAWRGGETWTAADSPRVEYAANGVLYKFYVTRLVRPGSGIPGRPEPDPIRDFLTEFLPQLRTALGPA